MRTIREFRDYLFTARALDLAIGVVLGLAFGTVITSLVRNMLSPVLSILGTVDFSELSFTIGGGTFLYGQLVNDVVAFLLVAIAVFFVVVRPRQAFVARMEAEQAPTRECDACLSTVPQAARRCAFCGETRPDLRT